MQCMASHAVHTRAEWPHYLAYSDAMCVGILAGPCCCCLCSCIVSSTCTQHSVHMSLLQLMPCSSGLLNVCVTPARAAAGSAVMFLHAGTRTSVHADLSLPRHCRRARVHAAPCMQRSTGARTWCGHTHSKPRMAQAALPEGLPQSWRCQWQRQSDCGCRARPGKPNRLAASPPAGPAGKPRLHEPLQRCQHVCAAEPPLRPRPEQPKGMLRPKKGVHALSRMAKCTGWPYAHQNTPLPSLELFHLQGTDIGCMAALNPCV